MIPGSRMRLPGIFFVICPPRTYIVMLGEAETSINMFFMQIFCNNFVMLFSFV